MDGKCGYWSSHNYPGSMRCSVHTALKQVLLPTILKRINIHWQYSQLLHGVQATPVHMPYWSILISYRGGPLLRIPSLSRTDSCFVRAAPILAQASCPYGYSSELPPCYITFALQSPGWPWRSSAKSGVCRGCALIAMAAPN